MEPVRSTVSSQNRRQCPRQGRQRDVSSAGLCTGNPGDWWWWPEGHGCLASINLCVSEGCPNSTQLWLHLVMCPLPAAEILLPSDFLEEFEKEICLSDRKHRHFMLRFSSENPFQVFVWNKTGFQHIPLMKLHIYVDALGFPISSLSVILCVNQAFILCNSKSFCQSLPSPTATWVLSTKPPVFLLLH